MGPQPWTTIVPGTPGMPPGQTGGCEIINGAPTLKCAEAVFANILSVVVTLTGIVLFIMLIVASFKYMTSGGDPKAAEGSKNAMSSAILGLGLIIGAYLILRLLSNFTGINLLKFEIPSF